MKEALLVLTELAINVSGLDQRQECGALNLDVDNTSQLNLCECW